MSQGPYDPQGNQAPGSPYGPPRQPDPGFPQSSGSPAGPPPGYGVPPNPDFGQQGPPAYSQPSPYGQPDPYGQPALYSQPGPYGQPGLQPGQTPPPPGFPGGPPGQPPKKKGKGLVIGIIVGVVVLALLAGVGVWFFFLRDADSTEPDKATKPANALRGYLSALAAGDAEKAKQYAKSAPDEAPTLTNEFLAAAVKQNPITEIDVKEPGQLGDMALVDASYRLGNTTATHTFDLYKVDSVWKLREIVTTISVPSSWTGGGFTIGGAPMKGGEKVSLFPGVYELATGTKFIEFKDTSITVKNPGYSSGLSSLAPELTDAAETEMVAQAKTLLEKCLATKVLVTPGCGFQARFNKAGVTLIESSIKWSISGSSTPFSSVYPRLSYSDASKITMTSYISLVVDAKGSDGNSYRGYSSITSTTGTIDGDTISVTFSR